MTLKNLRLALGLPLVLGACVTEQNLGDPQGTEGETSETEGTEGSTSSMPATSTTAVETETVGETDGPTETDGSIHDDCVELVWSCPSDDLVCLPEGLCVPCAAEGESPASADGGHCCEGLVQNADGTECVVDPNPNGCLAPGDICGFSGVTQDCCEGSVCNPNTDLCEPDGSTPGALCSDWEPPEIDNCAAGGKSSASGSIPETSVEPAEGLACSVTSHLPFGPNQQISLDCEGESIALLYSSASPVLSAPINAEDEVLLSFSFPDFGPELGFGTSFTLREPGGALLLAYIDHQHLDAPFTVGLDELDASYEVTGCAPFNAGAVACNLESESIVSAHVSVLLQSDEGSTELQAGGATELSIGGRTYDLIVDEANQIVCWDDGCAGDETGPFDQLQMLIVAR